MMIMLLLVFYTLIYQTTFRFFYIDVTSKTKNPSLYLKNRTISEQNIDQFSLKLRARDWFDLLSCNDPESLILSSPIL